MVPNKSLDEMVSLIIALLCDVQKLHSGVLSPRALRLTTEKVRKRSAREGIGFLTKTLPRLGKALDRALTGEVALDAASEAFEPLANSKLPQFLGELFRCVLSSDGWVLPCPNVTCVKSLRAVLYLFYKYELPNDPELEHAVVSKFIDTEHDVRRYSSMFTVMSDMLHCDPSAFYQLNTGISPWVIRRARRLLWEVFRGCSFDEIKPSHGPGAVAEKHIGLAKYMFDLVSPRTISAYPYDSYFLGSMGQVSEWLDGNELSFNYAESFARVCLVPKDSRGPRLISCEPKSFQWIQQGLRKLLYRHVEMHPLTRNAIHFTDQVPNGLGALLGSLTGSYATLDLNEASDRVSVGLVRLLFPEPLTTALLSARSLATVLPNGQILRLEKYAPMGSALCFPVLALTIWAILTAVAQDTGSGEEPAILVYGDDVVVLTAQAENAMNTLESFGLKINRTKSCTKGFFRESCGVDAFQGVDVTPVKLHTVWRHYPTPGVYSSFIAYANEFWKRQYFTLYGLIADWLRSVYGAIPDKSMGLVACPCLEWVPVELRPKRRRRRKSLQRLEYLVWTVRPHVFDMESSGWIKLQRFLSEAPSVCSLDDALSCPCSGGAQARIDHLMGVHEPFTASQYTERGAEELALVWVPVDPPAGPTYPVKDSDPGDSRDRSFPESFFYQV